MALYDDLPLKQNEIRLLRVSLRTIDDVDAPIHCTVKVVNLDKIGAANQYYALSYAWGAPAVYGRFAALTNTRKHPVVCNRHVVQVSENLYCFLRHLRAMLKLADNLFWIDAISINQDENAKEEKAYQIQQMGRIFSSAAAVIAWLGEADEYTETAFSMLVKLADPSVQKMIRFNNTTRAEYTTGLLSVVRLFQRTYFARAWIIQEIVLAESVRVLCGRHEIDWNVITDASHMFSTTGFRDFLNTMHFALTEAEVNFNAPTVLKAIKSGRLGQQWTETLVYTLIRTRNFRSSQSCDKVYSLLGLLQQDILGKDLLRPGYSMQSVEVIYTNTAIRILETGEDLLLLSCVEGELFQHAKAGESMASWVPDWREEKPLGLRGTGYRRYQAAGGLAQRPVIDHVALTLTLKGIMLDRITMTGEAKHEVVRSQWQPFASWLQILVSLPTLYYGIRQNTDVKGEHRLEAFWRTLLVNTGGSTSHMLDQNTSRRTSFAHWFKALYYHRRSNLLDDDDEAWLSEAAPQSSALEHSVLEQGGHEFRADFEHGKHLRLFRTESGYLGLGSESLRSGDEVWIVPGSPVPLIFRTVGGRSRYRLVGGTYLHGFMKGEAVDPLIRGMSTEEVEKQLEQIIIV
ncbi:heterokaryon incompatibility protein-domain-containing protein [Nemania sp. FL0031]|nr:heterokaryon incompatibility protein-domain-containing protein [Nemania sp. FL0031]